MAPKTDMLKLSPPQFVFASNVVCAALGLAQGLIVARYLGPSAYGVMAILATLGGVAANFWDVRLIDLAIRQHYALAKETESPQSAQTASMQLALVLNAGLALLMGISSVLLAILFSPFFTTSQLAPWWIAAQGIGIGGSFLVGTFQSMQRLADDFYSFGLVRVLTQFIALPVTVLFMVAQPDLSGYYGALVATIILNLAVSTFFLAHLWQKHFGMSLAASGMLSALPLYRGQMRFIFSANILSYSKMLTRSGDVLVFGFFASDAATGIYRLARTLADGLGIVNTSLSQYYYPTFMRLLHEGREAEISALIHRFVGYALAALVVILPAAFGTLHLLNGWILQDAYEGLPLACIILMTGFFWTAGIHNWLWPFLVERNQTHRMALWAMTGGLLQLGLIALLPPVPAWAALGTPLYYLVCYMPLLLWWKRECRPISS